MTTLLTILGSTSLLTFFSLTAQARPPGPMLTDEQRSCIEEKVGIPGESPRPSRQEMRKAFKACGIKPPQKPAWLKNLSEKERGCLRGELGDPADRSGPPSRMEVLNAARFCHIEIPAEDV